VGRLHLSQPVRWTVTTAWSGEAPIWGNTGPNVGRLKNLWHIPYRLGHVLLSFICLEQQTGNLRGSPSTFRDMEPRPILKENRVHWRSALWDVRSDLRRYRYPPVPGTCRWIRKPTVNV